MMMIDSVFCHTNFKQVVGRMIEVHQQTHERKYSLIVTGLSGSGKSSLGRWYEAQYTDDGNRKSVCYVLLCQPSSPLNFVAQILESLGVPSLSRRPTFSVALHQLQRVVQERNIEMIILDEVQECLPDTCGIKAQMMAKTLVAIINLCNIPLVLLGTPSATRIIELSYLADGSGISKEEQLSSRFLSPISLRHLARNSEDWSNLAEFFCKKHCLDLNVNDQAFLDRLYVASHGKLSFMDRLFAFVDKNSDKELLQLFEESFHICDTTRESNPFNTRSYNKYILRLNILKLHQLHGLQY